MIKDYIPVFMIVTSAHHYPIPPKNLKKRRELTVLLDFKPGMVMTIDLITEQEKPSIIYLPLPFKALWKKIHKIGSVFLQSY